MVLIKVTSLLYYTQKVFSLGKVEVESLRNTLDQDTECIYIQKIILNTIEKYVRCFVDWPPCS